MPSNIRPSTRAVSAMDSFLPIWLPEGSRYVTPMPRSWPATSKAQRVRVEVFSKIRAMFLPLKSSWAMPAFFFAFSSAARSISPSISSGVKSNSFKKLLPFKFMSDASMLGLISDIILPGRRKCNPGNVKLCDNKCINIQ